MNEKLTVEDKLDFLIKFTFASHAFRHKTAAFIAFREALSGMDDKKKEELCALLDASKHFGNEIVTREITDASRAIRKHEAGPGSKERR